MHPPPHRRDSARGTGAFTLIELLVIIGILGLLATLLVPSVLRARLAGGRAACQSNLRQVGIAVHNYAQDHEDRIPYGPVAPPFTHPADFYPSTGSPTSLLSIRKNGAPVGLGLLLQGYLARVPSVVFCPGSDQALDAATELAKVGITQAQGSYYYRHGGVTRLFYESPTEPECTRLLTPGTNRNGAAIRALAMDSQFLCSDSVAMFNVKPRTHHQRQWANTLFYDGAVRAFDNRDDRFTVDVRNNADLYDSFNRILKLFENADSMP